MEGPNSFRRVRFGPFEVDRTTGELRKQGRRLKLAEQPFQVLAALLEKPGELVTREELRRRIWSDNTFVDFDHSLNKAINKVREVLGDSSSDPRYVETLPRRGYRFIAPVDGGPPVAAETLPRAKRLQLWVGGVVAVAIVAATAGWLGSRTDTATAPLKVVPLTAYPGVEENPSFSPDGNQVAFSWNGPDQNNFDIYVQMVGSSTPLRLTSDPAPDGSPGFSPDGRQIAFLRQRAEAVSEVLLVPPLGGPERKLAEIQVGRSQFDTSLSWSPDGKSLLVRDRSSLGERPGVFVLSIDNGEKRRLTSPPEGTTYGDMTPVFSPDGRMVAFERSIGWSVSDIHLVPTPGGQPTRLTFDKGNPDGLTWTADGYEIVFSRRGALWRVSARGGPPKQLVGIPERQIQPVISLTGRRLAYVERTYDTDIWHIDTQAPPEGRLPEKIIASTRGDANPQFSPDGKRIVFVSGRSGAWEIWVCRSDGSNPLQVTSIGDSGTPRWSPDGQSITFDSGSSGNGDIYVVSAAGGSHRRITTNSTSDACPSWSRDGRWIFFFSDRTGENQVWKAPMEGEGHDGNLAVQVTKHGGLVPFESADGKYVFYFKREGPVRSIWRVPAEGGEETPVIESFAGGMLSWALSEEGIYFRDQRTSDFEERWVVRFFSFDRQSVSEIVELTHPPQPRGPGFAVSPNGRWILGVQTETNSDLMVVEDFR